MARARSLLWIGALAGIVYLLWRWRSQQTSGPGLLPGPTPGTPGPSSFVAPAGADSAGAPPEAAPAPDEAPEQPPEPATPPAAAAVAIRERAVGAAAPVENEPPAPEAEQAQDADIEGVDLAPLVGPAADAEGVDLAPLVGPAALGDAGLGGPVNINTADLEALIALPGIGPALARRIIAYRKQHGPFSSVDQLVEIQGIGPRNIDEFRHLVTV